MKRFVSPIYLGKLSTFAVNAQNSACCVVASKERSSVQGYSSEISGETPYFRSTWRSGEVAYIWRRPRSTRHDLPSLVEFADLFADLFDIDRLEDSKNLDGTSSPGNSARCTRSMVAQRC